MSLSLVEFHKATTDELLAVRNKVRNLVTHWPEEGRYREAILKNIIKRFLPRKYAMGTGFVVKQTRTRGEHLQSKQIDLIIYDDASPILFQEGDVVILTPDSVRAIIEIKANLESNNVEDVLRAANANGEFIFSGKKDKSKKMFNGVFSYERLDGSRNMERIIRSINESNIPFSSLI